MIRIVVSIGCPCGVGPEVALAAAAEFREPKARVALVGDEGALRAAASVVGARQDRLVVLASVEDAWTLPLGVVGMIQPTRPLRAAERRWGKPGRAAGRAQLAWIDAAADLVRAGRADAMVTGPVSKETIARSGAPGASRFSGHTEHLAARLGAREVTMAFVAAELTTSLVTTHLPIARVPRAITPSEVARAVFWTADLVSRLHGRGAVAVAALNPHAGEGGLLGNEEKVAIAPGIARAESRITRAGLDVSVSGPLPAETAFRLAARGAYRAVVAMYHDQATIPMKLLGFGDAVNVSLGLPIVRTSVDHGTAYDRAGQGTADPRGMKQALALAVRLSDARTSRRRASRSRRRT